MLTHVEFRSDRFGALEGEDKVINPDLWGKQLADFLKVGLKTQGIETTEPIAEDWGWALKIKNESAAFWIGCGHYQEYSDGYLCFIEPHKASGWKFFRKVDAKDRIASLQRALDTILSEEAGIHSKRWWTYEDFSHQSRNTPGVQS